MMQEYRQQQAVDRWLDAKWRVVAAVAALASGAAILFASLLDIIARFGH